MNTSVFIYIGLTIIALLPLFGLKPFTLLISRFTTPEIVQRTSKFRQVNRLLSFYWAFLFAISALCAFLFRETAGEWIVPLGICALVGAPTTVLGVIKLPEYVREKQPYPSCRELFELMPYGICKRYAKAVDIHAVAQFHLSGSEPLDGFLEIDGTRCGFSYGQARHADLRISCDADLWLKIANGEADGIEASINGSLKVEGEAWIMLHLNRLFLTGWKIERPHSSVDPRLYAEYDKPEPVSIRKAVIFYSGKRNGRFSRTSFLASNLAEGLEAGGCEVDWVNLAGKNISECTGCFTCWTKTPGQCIHKDDMAGLIEKYVGADLAVFASPLYTFSVNGIMKSFMDRLIPMLKPYMAKNPQGKTFHPKRWPEHTPTHIFTVSAAGFPEVEGNFDGFRALFKSWSTHMEGAKLLGEMLLPAAEMIALPEFGDRKRKIAEAGQAIGLSLAQKGFAPSHLMRRISDTGLSQKEFAHMANLFWKNLDGKDSYMRHMGNFPLQ